MCSNLGIKFIGRVINDDFIKEYVSSSNVLSKLFTHIIINPPYKKINVSSNTYDRLAQVALQTTNMYSAFISISNKLLAPYGQMTFISPRSFCNGMYFYQFRKRLLESVSLKHIHLFSSRTLPFNNYNVLQENVILSTKKNGRNQYVTISSSTGPSDPIVQRSMKKNDVIFDDDRLMFIHISTNNKDTKISRKMHKLPCTLDDLGIEVSTGKVIDFRISDELRFSVEKNSVPLVRPHNITDTTMRFPLYHKKHPNFIMSNKKSRKHLVKNGNYVIVKRFTTVEQKNRITASIWTKNEYDSDLIGFENRINYFHNNGSGLSPSIAYGLWAFLNSSGVNTYFRQFNGSTQVNASDLRYLKYPTWRQLVTLGRSVMHYTNESKIPVTHCSRVCDDYPVHGNFVAPVSEGCMPVA